MNVLGWMIASHPVDLDERVIYETREREGKKSIHIVPSVTIQSYSRSSNLLAL